MADIADLQEEYGEMYVGKRLTKLCHFCLYPVVYDGKGSVFAITRPWWVAHRDCVIRHGDSEFWGLVLPQKGRSFTAPKGGW